MFERILKCCRERILGQQYVMTHHAGKEMNGDDLTVFDLEHGILTGKMLERQKDRVTGEWKNRIGGQTLEDDKLEVIVKLSPTEKLVIITVYIL
ncbi:MAG: DUF4258 domain-containing protein [Candidatus Kuenenia sp.]|nr:DUF4258 domain-containing protein [Candidatus Kuenenia sp.]